MQSIFGVPGGGSSLDVGKSIVLQAALNRPLWDCTDGGSFWNENDYVASMLCVVKRDANRKWQHVNVWLRCARAFIIAHLRGAP